MLTGLTPPPTLPPCVWTSCARWRSAISTSTFPSPTGRTVFVPRGDETVGRQLLMALFESDDEQYAWLNSEVCIAEGVHDPQNPPSRAEVYLCTNDLV